MCSAPLHHPQAVCRHTPPHVSGRASPSKSSQAAMSAPQAPSVPTETRVWRITPRPSRDAQAAQSDNPVAPRASSLRDATLSRTPLTSPTNHHYVMLLTTLFSKPYTNYNHFTQIVTTHHPTNRHARNETNKQARNGVEQVSVGLEEAHSYLRNAVTQRAQ